MNHLLSRVKNLDKDQVLTCVSCLLVFFSCFTRPWCNIAQGIWLFFCVVFTFRQWPSNLRQLRERKNIWPCIAVLLYIVLGLLSMTYAAQPGLAGHALMNAQFSLWAFPLVALLCNLKLDMRLLLKTYVFGTFCFVVYLFAAVAWRLWCNEQMNIFFFESWTGVTQVFYDIMNRSYSNTAVVLALISMSYLFFHKSIHRRWGLLYIFMGVVFLFFLVVNTSRMVLGAAVVVACVGVFVASLKKKKFIVPGLLLVFILLGVVLLTDNRLSVFFWSFVEGLRDGNLNFSDPRAHIWNAVFAIDGPGLFSGFGLANAFEPLMQKYAEMDYQIELSGEMNSHNQFLSIYLQLGWIGVLVLLAIFVLPTICAKKTHWRLPFLVSLLFVLVMLTECFMERQAGALLVATWLCVILPSEFTNENKLALEQSVLAKLHFLSIAIVVMALSSIAAFVSVLNNRLNADALMSRCSAIMEKNELHDGHPVYHMDRRNECIAWEGNTYAYFPFFISRNQTKTTYMEVDCFISSDYNGSWAKINATALNTDERTIMLANMSIRDQWQTLRLTLLPGDNYVFFYICQEDALNFSNLKGKVLFSNPRWIH
ncbi:MAG: O-antigen ligase family protein [Paludibacteraceae bacterium]|nr:O-antigen ligase family protein [Paludibacteraceae bacterium]